MPRACIPPPGRIYPPAATHTHTHTLTTTPRPTNHGRPSVHRPSQLLNQRSAPPVIARAFQPIYLSAPISEPPSPPRDISLPDKKMATAFIMPRLPDHQQTFGHFHAPPQLSSQAQTQTQTPIYTQPQISPLSTGANSTSPTSPKSCYGRQKRPLYMPAVLRPSQPPARAAAAKKQDDDSDSLKAAANNGLIGAFGRLSRRSTNDSSKSSDSDWNLFPKPTAQPTRRHWKVCLICSPMCTTCP